MATQFFGQYLLARGLLTRSQLLEAVDYQERNNLRLGEYAVKKGVITNADSARIVATQSARDVQFGEAALELGLLSSKQIEDLLRAQRADHVFLGDALVRLNLLSAEAVNSSLDIYRQEQQGQEGDSIFVPPDVPNVALVAEACDLTRKILLRAWGTPTKYGVSRSGLTSVTFEGAAVEVPVSGDSAARYAVGIPDDLSTPVIRRLFGIAEPTHEERLDMVAEFANVVVGNLVASLTNVGRDVTLGPPVPLPAGGELSLRDEQAFVIPLVAPTCEVLVAIAYAADGNPRSR